jgi:hypothetical protein
MKKILETPGKLEEEEKFFTPCFGKQNDYSLNK